MIKVSICIPCYLHPECMERLLDSIEEQTFQDYEVVITDDSDTDVIEQVVKSRAASFQKKIHYRHNEKRLGHIHNWNEAIRLANGQYVKIMFSDDWFTFPDSLQKMVSLLDANRDADLAFCGSRQVSSKRSYDRAASDVFLTNLSKDYRTLFMGNEIGAPSAVIMRGKAAMFEDRSNWASDMFLYFNVFMKNPLFASTKEPLISIGESDEQYTYTFSEYDERKYKDYLLMFEMYDIKKNAECRAYFLREFLVPYKKGPFSAWKTGNSYGNVIRYALRHHKRYFLPGRQ